MHIFHCIYFAEDNILNEHDASNNDVRYRANCAGLTGIGENPFPLGDDHLILRGGGAGTFWK